MPRPGWLILRFLVALLAEGVDRNKNMHRTVTGVVGSPSSRRAWIEISTIYSKLSIKFVALLAEGVDRNIAENVFGLIKGVALLAEGVDRNHELVGVYDVIPGSPSSRRAWIEI